MERWFFGEDKANGTTESMQHMQLTEPSGRKHIFRVMVNQTLEPNEHVAVTGECFSLGKWLPAHVVQLQRENGELYFEKFYGKIANNFANSTLLYSRYISSIKL